MTTNPSPRHSARKGLKPTDILVTGKHNQGKRSTEVKVVEVEWIDAVSIGGDDWTDHDEQDFKGMPSLAIGYLVHEDDEYISLVGLVNTQHYSHGITIPKGCIHKIRLLV